MVQYVVKSELINSLYLVKRLTHCNVRIEFRDANQPPYFCHAVAKSRAYALISFDYLLLTTWDLNRNAKPATLISHRFNAAAKFLHNSSRYSKTEP